MHGPARPPGWATRRRGARRGLGYVPPSLRQVDVTAASTVITLGTPRDVTVQELRIECFFPEDDETEAPARSLLA